MNMIYIAMSPTKGRAMQPKVGKKDGNMKKEPNDCLAKQMILQDENTFLQSPVRSAIISHRQPKLSVCGKISNDIFKIL